MCNRLCVFDLHQVVHHAQHPLNLGNVLVFHYLVDFAEAEGYQRQLLPLGLVDRATHQFYLYLAHLLSSYEL